jgi:hypothetical protein
VSLNAGCLQPGRYLGRIEPEEVPPLDVRDPFLDDQPPDVAGSHPEVVREDFDVDQLRQELNHRARERMAEASRLTGPEVIAPGGRKYQAGDQVVTLAPGANGALVTGERAVVESVDIDRERLVPRTEDERRVALLGEELSAERLAHGYAVAHRSQGQTTERAHLYVDGGGRELAYVAMSRARESTHADLVADNLDQVVEDLAREWSAERRLGWVTDLGVPQEGSIVDIAVRDLDRERARHAAFSHARVSITLEARRVAGPADPTLDIVKVNKHVRELRELRRDLEHGQGVANTEAGQAGRNLTQAHRHAAHPSWMAESASSWRGAALPPQAGGHMDQAGG